MQISDFSSTCGMTPEEIATYVHTFNARAEQNRLEDQQRIAEGNFGTWNGQKIVPGASLKFQRWTGTGWLKESAEVTATGKVVNFKSEVTCSDSI